MRGIFVFYSLLLCVLLLCALPPAYADKQALNAALVKAVDHLKPAQIRELVAQGADVNARNDIGQTVLERAAQYGDYASVKTLSDLGADVNSTSNYGGPLTSASQALYGNSPVAVCRLLLERGANPNGHPGKETPLLSALQEAVGTQEQSGSVLSSIAVSTTDHSPLGQQRAEEMAKTEQERLRKAFIRAEQGRITKAHETGLQIVRLLIAKGADVNLSLKDGTSPLMAAARVGSVEAVNLLLERGARSDARTADHRTVLMFASISAELSRLLLDKGGDVNAKDDRGYTALINATMGKNADVVRVLVEYGADVNAKNLFGNTPLLNAETWGDLTAVRFLLDHGADINEKDKDGKTPLQLAWEYKNADLVSLLQNAGAKK